MNVVINHNCEGFCIFPFHSISSLIISVLSSVNKLHIKVLKPLSIISI